MPQGFFEKDAFVVSDEYTGAVDIDIWPARNILEELVLLRGYGAFEVMEARAGVVFHLEDHLKRMEKSMCLLRLPVPTKDRLDFADFCKKIVDWRMIFPWKDKRASLVWVIASAGRTFDGYNPCGPTNIYVLVSKFPNVKFGAGKGLVLRVFEHEREFPDVKTPNYCFAEIAQHTIDENGSFDDILYVSKTGKILETSKANFFIVDYHGAIKTPGKNILRGITRDILLNLARAKGCAVREEEIKAWEIMDAKEAFIASTTRFVWPVKKIFIPGYFTKNFSSGNPVALGLRRDFLEYRRRYYKERRA